MTKKMIWFDMDGTIADLYSVENWLEKLVNGEPAPYQKANPMLNMNLLARYIHALQRKGWAVGIISWLAKNSTPDYDEKVKAAKMAWLKKHLGSVNFDNIHIVPYGTNKYEVCKGGILFDDEEKNRKQWGNLQAFIPSHIMTVLKNLNAA